MQVNSGKNKGTKLFSPVGEDVRPTTDKVKQAIFNMISIGMLSGNALDLFAGSGAMGIEALSRGCDFCDFSDLDTTYVEKNIEKCKLSQKCYIFKGSFEKLISSSKRKYSYVFLDPPYHKGLIEKALFLLTSKNLLNDGAIIVMESDFDEDFEIPNQIQIIKEKTYGRIRVKIGEFKEVQ